VAACLVAFPAAAFAQHTFVDLLRSVRSVGMGESGVADGRDPGNVYFNPANVTGIEGVYGTGSYMLVSPFFDTDMWLGHGSLGGGRTFGAERKFRLGLDLTLARLDFGTVRYGDVFDPQGVIVDMNENLVSAAVGGSMAFAEFWQVALGVTYKRWTKTFDEVATTTGPVPGGYATNMFDVGAVLSSGVDAGEWSLEPALGVALVNMGPEIDYRTGSYPPPSWLNYGVSVRVAAPRVALGSASVPTVSAVLNVDGKHGMEEQHPRWAFGSEVGLLEAIFLRWGRQIDDWRRTTVTTWGVAAGVPVGRLRARLEYANLRRAGTNIYEGAVHTDKFGATVVWLFDHAE
jgi:hypothetical protein